jgi:hypothetical protein
MKEICKELHDHMLLPVPEPEPEIIPEPEINNDADDESDDTISV